MPSTTAAPTTVRARPITFAEIEALAAADHPADFDGFMIEESIAHGVTLTPTTFAVDPLGSAYRKSSEFYAPVPDDRPNVKAGAMRANRDVVVGRKVKVRSHSMFGTQTDLDLFTSGAAEESAAVLHGYTNPERSRVQVYMADDQGEEYPLTPVYGAQVTAGFIVKGLTADEARERAERALAAEFGDDLNRLRKMNARPVIDKRVNLYDSMAGQGAPIAVNVLPAEASYVATPSVYSTAEVGPETVIGG